MWSIKQIKNPICRSVTNLFWYLLNNHAGLGITLAQFSLTLVYTRSGYDLKIKDSEIRRELSPAAFDSALTAQCFPLWNLLFLLSLLSPLVHLWAQSEIILCSSCLSRRQIKAKHYLSTANVLTFAENFKICRWHLCFEVRVVTITVNKMWQADILLTFPWSPGPKLFQVIHRHLGFPCGPSFYQGLLLLSFCACLI